MLSRLGGRLLTSHVHYEAALSLALTASAKGVSGGLSAKVAVQVGLAGGSLPLRCSKAGLILQGAWLDKTLLSALPSTLLSSLPPPATPCRRPRRA